MEHRTFVPTFGVLAAALTSVWISPQASAGDPSGIREEGWANIEIMPNESTEAKVTVVPKAVSSTRPIGSQQGYLGVGFGLDRSALGAAATLRRVHLEPDGNGEAFAPGAGGRDACTHGGSASGRDAEG